MNENPLWVEKYRPQTIEETILPNDLKKTFQTFVDQKQIPNLILAGSSGVGKTTVAKAMLEELSCDYIVINGSMKGNIDTLRNDIQQFASSVSLSGGRKYVILDEADYLNCLEENEMVRLFDGSAIKLKDMKADTEYNVVSFNVHTLEFESDIATVLNRTEKETFKVTLDDGSCIEVTADHPFIVKDCDGIISERSINDGLTGYEIVLK